MESIQKLFFLFILTISIKIYSAEGNGSVTVLDEKFENKLSAFANYATKYLEDFNDRHLSHSEIGKMLNYDVLKPKIGSTGRGIKKLSMALIPLIFHVGATSTWMVLTTLLAAKSVAIGLALLIFKIAVSSAKVASFFTALKAKNYEHHHDWSYAPAHYDHHGHARSLIDLGSYYAPPSWTPENHEYPTPSYKTIPTHPDPFNELEYKNNGEKGLISHS